MVFNCTKYLLSGLAVLLLSVHCKAQTYDYSFKENKIELISSALLHGSVLLYDQLRPVSLLDDGVSLDKEELWAFDQSAVDQNSTKADSWSDVALYMTISGPLLLGLNKYEHDNYGNILLMGLQGYLMQDALTQLVKILAKRPRPYLYNVTPEVARMYQTKTDTKSFYSGHTSTAAYLSFFTARVFSHTQKDSKLKPLVWSLAAIAPGLTGYFRYKAGKHFPTDAIVGYIMGASFGILIPEIYFNKNIELSPTAMGVKVHISF